MPSLIASLLLFTPTVKTKPATRTKPRLSRAATHDGIVRRVSELNDEDNAESASTGFGKRTSACNRRVALVTVLLGGLAAVLLIQGRKAPARPRHQLDDVVDGLRQTMLRDSFVHVDGATFRELLVWQGADPSDLNAIEMGKIHAATEQDKEPTMAFRQVAFHRMVSLQGKRFQPAHYQAITQIAEKGAPPLLVCTSLAVGLHICRALCPPRRRDHLGRWSARVLRALGHAQMEPAAVELRAELAARCALAREHPAHVRLAALQSG